MAFKKTLSFKKLWKEQEDTVEKQSGPYHIKLCLQSFYGYIALDNIHHFADLLNPLNYCRDLEVWISPYIDFYKNDEDYKKVAQLGKVLKKHWKN